VPDSWHRVLWSQTHVYCPAACCRLLLCLQFLRFVILLSNMIPISLYVSLEVVKVFQCALLLNQDREMYHK
jgi:magnesium-transporting ATPase (P-type)